MSIDTAQTLYQYKELIEKYKIKQIRKEELVLKTKNINYKLSVLDKELIDLEIEMKTLKDLLKI